MNLSLQELEDQYQKLMAEITRLENEKKERECRSYLEAIWPCIDEYWTFKTRTQDSLFGNKSLQELKGLTKEDWKLMIGSMPELGMAVFFIDQLVDPCYMLTHHMFDRMIADGHQRIEDIEDTAIYDGEFRILTKYLLLSMFKVRDPIYDDIYGHHYIRAFQEAYGVYEDPPQQGCVIS
jgi:hypothetical protein